MAADHNELKIQSLLKEFEEQRANLKQMILDVEELKKNIENLFPEKLEARYKTYFEEKVKAAMSVFNVLLDIRKELNKSMREEIEIRRRVQADSGAGLEDLINIRELAERVDKLKDKKLTLIKRMGEEDDGGKSEGTGEPG